MAAVSSAAARQSAGASVYSSNNVRHLCRMELPGGGQIVIQGRYAYVGHQHRPDGTTILDISDPRAPKIVSKLMTAHPWTHSHKVRVVGDLMVVNSEIEPGAGDRLAYPEGGFRIYDIKDPANPKLVSFVKTHARGVHRFDLDESYAYISTEMEGFVGNILVIYDIRNPSKPIKVSRWWMPGQNAAAGEPAHPKGRSHSLRQRALCRLLVLGRFDHRHFGHHAAAHPRSSRIRSAPCGADPHVLEVAFPHPRPEHRGVNRGGAADARSRHRKAARTLAHLGCDRPDQADDPPYLTSPGSRQDCGSSTSMNRRTRSRRATSSRSLPPARPHRGPTTWPRTTVASSS